MPLSQGPSPPTHALEVLQGWKPQGDAADLSNEGRLHGTPGDRRGHGRHPGRAGLHGFWEALAFTVGLL